MKKTTFILLFGLTLAGCSPKLTADMVRNTTPLTEDDLVLFLDEWTPAPPGAEYYGSIKVDDRGQHYASSGMPTVYSLAEAKARECGANVINITKHIYPASEVNTDRIKADLYHLDNVKSFIYEAPATEEHPDYAAIYFYRNSTLTPNVIYDVLIGDQKVFRAKKLSSAEVKVYEPGEVRIWAKLEKTEEITLDLELGKNYYIDCSVTSGTFFGNPSFEVVPDGLGYHTYNAMQARY